MIQNRFHIIPSLEAKIKKIAAIALLMLWVAGCTDSNQNGGQKPSLLSLLANPSQFSNAEVVIYGYLIREDSHARLYLTKEHGFMYDIDSSIIIDDFTPEKERIFNQDLKNSYSKIIGKFDYMDKYSDYGIYQIDSIVMYEIEGDSVRGDFIWRRD